jgi:hypothetical protein
MENWCEYSDLPSPMAYSKPEKNDLINEIERSGFIYRKFLSKDEIKLANSLVKEGLLYKGYPNEKGATIAFFIK